MKAAVIVFPGSNCDRDVAVCLKASGSTPLMVWHKETEIPKADLIVLPGGFSYGDYLRAGAMAAHSPILRELIQKAKAGTPVLGICNGFQILTETGLLPGALMRNANLKFICHDVFLKVEQTRPPFTGRYAPNQIIRMPIAHHDGNYFAADDTLKCLEDDGRIVFRYSDQKGAVNAATNPNGSAHNIAGITNERGNILGMMPHPERLADAALGGIDGKPLFDGLSDMLEACA